MKKIFSSIITLTLLLALVVPIFSSSFVEARTIDQQSTHLPVKPWTITFNDAVNSDKANLDQIYVQSADNKRISLKVSADLKKVVVIPENHYIFGETYTLVIPKGFESANGQELPEDTTMAFKIEGEFIEEITAVVIPNFVTNVVIKGSDEIDKVKVSVNKAPAVDLRRSGPGTHFSNGFLGLMKGDHLTIQVFNQSNRLLETQYYIIK